jgi:uncharacterized protein YjcR
MKQKAWEENIVRMTSKRYQLQLDYEEQGLGEEEIKKKLDEVVPPLNKIYRPLSQKELLAESYDQAVAATRMRGARATRQSEREEAALKETGKMTVKQAD